jgi:CheY-like chemotaxis protein
MNANPDLAGRRVLVIEDESTVTMLLEDHLEELGCEVAGIAYRFDDALQKATSLSFDVVILDVNLAGKLTYPIAESLAQRGSAFVFATGYGSQTLPPQFNTRPVLQKPFDLAELTRALREALAHA